MTGTGACADDEHAALVCALESPQLVTEALTKGSGVCVCARACMSVKSRRVTNTGPS